MKESGEYKVDEVFNKILADLHRDEPTWCLHIQFTDGSNPIFYRSLTMKELVKELSDWNKNYKLWPDRWVEGRWATSGFIWIFAERRNEK